MRYVVLAVLVVAGCSDSPNRQEFTNSETAFLQLHARVGDIEKRLGAQPAMPDLMPLTDRIAALEGRASAMEAAMAKLQPQKVPHLVSRDTGVDYGISIDGALAAWDPKFEAVIDYSKSRTVSFTGPKCSGQPIFDPNVDTNAKFNRYLFMPDGRLARLSSSTKINAPDGSMLEPDGTCTDQPNVYGYPATLAPFSTPRATPESLDIALR